MASATGYTIQISTNNLFTSTVVNSSVISGSTLSFVPTADLPVNTVLDWRVRTNGVNGPGSWSEVRSLIITP